MCRLGSLWQLELQHDLETASLTLFGFHAQLTLHVVNNPRYQRKA
jgi:hypothetical protein